MALHVADVDAAAQIWSETTAVRDGDDDIAPLDMSRPLIQTVLDAHHGRCCWRRSRTHWRQPQPHTPAAANSNSSTAST